MKQLIKSLISFAIIEILWIFGSVPSLAQTGALSGYCILGAKQAITSGLNSSNYLLGVIPSCTVTVYLTGTTTLATIYFSQGGSAYTGPFTANTDGSWLFYAAQSQGYDVVLSGGVRPNVYPSSVTLTDVFAGGGSGSGTVNTGTAGQIAYYASTGNTVSGETLVPAAHGGTGLDTSASTGVPVITSGTWSIDGTLPVSLGGTGTSTPSLVAGTNVTVTGTWPNQTISASGGGGTSVYVNGSLVNEPNFNGTTPSADSGYTAATWKPSGSDVIVEVPTNGNVSPNATFAFTGISINDDDAHVIEPTAIALSGYICDGSTCTITSSTAHGFSAGDWVNMREATDFATSNSAMPSYETLGTGYTLFKVITAPTTTSFTFAYTAASPTCSTSCGSAYLANYNLPFAVWINLGKPGTPVVSLSNPVTIVGSATNYTSLFHSISPAVTNKPGYLIINNGSNDVRSGSTAATVETAYTSIFEQAHADGWIVVVGSDTAFNDSEIYYSNVYKNEYLLMDWLKLQAKTEATAASGAYWDLFVDVGSVVNDSGDTALVASSNSGLGPSGAALAASRTAQVVATNQSSPISNYPIRNGRGGKVVFQPSGGDNPIDSFVFYTPDHAHTYMAMNYNVLGTYFSLPVEIDGVAGGTTRSAFTVYNTSTDSNIYSPEAKVSQSHSNISSDITRNNIRARIEETNSAFGFDYGLNYSSTTKSLDAAYVHMDSSTYDVYHATSDSRICMGVPTVQYIDGVTPQQGCPTSKYFTVGPSGQFYWTTDGYPGIVGASSGSYLKADGTGYGTPSAGITSVAGSSPIVASTSGTAVTVSCPTCGVSTGGTAVALNSASSLGTLAITGYMPQVCADTSGSGTAQSCTTATSFTPQTGNCIVYSTTTANSSTALTLNINSLGAASVAVPSSSGWTTTLTASSSIPAGKPMHMCYDGTNWNASGTGYQAAGSGTTIPYSTQYTYVAETDSTSVSSITSPSITVTASDVMVVACRYGGTGYATGATASGSSVGTWNYLTAETASSVGLQVSWGVVTTAGATTFTCTPSSSSGYLSMTVMEIAGTLGTANTSVGNTSSLSVFGPFYYQPMASASTTARTAVISCSSIGASYVYTLPAIQNGFTSSGIIGVSAASIGATSDTGCYMTIIPETSTVTNGSLISYAMVVNSSSNNTAGSVLYLNY